MKTIHTQKNQNPGWGEASQSVLIRKIVKTVYNWEEVTNMILFQIQLILQ